MTNLVLTDHVASISELKANPTATVKSAGGQTVAILNRNQPAFYAVPAELYERLMDTMDDMELAKIVRNRKDQPSIKVSLDEL